MLDFKLLFPTITIYIIVSNLNKALNGTENYYKKAEY